jgi:tryptophan synthase alpha chain
VPDLPRNRDDAAPSGAISKREAGRATTLAIYLMAGRDTPELARAAVDGGADMVEIGFPFSDPLADGPVIRRAAERALAEGMRTKACLECLARTRETVDVPLVPMTYASLLEAYGYDRFAADAAAAGASSLIVADLPAGERPDLRRVQLVAPTSTDERIALAAAQTDGWLYLVTVAGTTGARDDLSPALAGLVERARELTDVPLYAGFGISTPEQARAAAELADGVVVGSAAVQAAEGGPQALRDYVASLRSALDGASPTGPSQNPSRSTSSRARSGSPDPIRQRASS